MRVANGTQNFTLTSTSAATQFVGATLVVVYRLVTPGNPRIAPLRSVVIYDGSFTGTPGSGLNQTMPGIVQAASDADPKMTLLAGNGQKGFKATLMVNNSIPQGVPSNPFVGAQGANWDNYTFNYNLAANAASVETSVNLNSDCLSWAAIITSVNVQDTDFDGIPDVAEEYGININPGVRYDGVVPPPSASPAPAPATFGTCARNASTCLNLPEMGANPRVPDIFMQVDWMYDLNGTNNPDGTYNPPHSHNPQFAALKMVGDVFKAHGINIHFDVGNDNPLSPYCQAANSATIGKCTYQSYNSPYIVLGAYAHGGNAIDEAGNLLCPNSITMAQNPQPACAFPSQSNLYSVLGWKFGFDAIRDGDPVLGLPQLFPENEKDTVHYALFGHAIAATTPLSTPEAGSISGVADHPGGDILVTLGLWRSDIPAADQVGTLLDQAGTLMHELGHNLGLSHGGWNDTPTCMPDYPSVMNYLYQVAGLTDSAGNEHLDYSYGLLLPLAENDLSVKIPMGLQAYRVRYFGPYNGNTSSPLANTPGQASKAYCSGGYPTEPGQPYEYVRLEWPSISTPDWSNGTVLPLGTKLPALDINFDGTTGNNPTDITNETFTDSPDWLSINLQQVSARPAADGFSLDLGLSQIGLSQIGLSQIGLSQIGLSQIGLSQIGLSQIGLSQIGLSQIGISDAGTAALGQDALGDQDYAGFILSGGLTPPSGFTVAVTTNQPSPTNPNPGGTGNYLSWTGNSGVASQYNIYRCNASISASCIPTLLTNTTSTSGTPPVVTPSYTDFVNDYVHAGSTCPPAPATCYNTAYNYYVTEVNTIGSLSSESGASSTVSGEVNHVFVTGTITPLSIVYGTANPAITVNIEGNGTLTSLTSPPSSLPTPPLTQAYCVYTATAGPWSQLSPPAALIPRNVGTYYIFCTGPSVVSTTVGVTYNVTNLTYTPPPPPSTLTITQRPITVTAASSKVYDGNTACPIPTCTAGPVVTWAGSGPALAYSDTPNFSESFDNKNVNVPTNTHTVTPAGTVNDGGSPVGSNYTYTFVQIKTGVITPAALTITATTNTKTYDSTTSAAAIPTTSVVCDGTTVTGPQALCGSDTITNLAETYGSPNAGSGLTLSVSPGYTISDNNNGNNYTVTPVTNSGGVIYTKQLTPTLTAANKVYDGTTTESNSMSCTVATVVAGDTVNCTPTAGAFNYATVLQATSVTATATISGSSVSNYTLGAAMTTTSVTSTSATASANITTKPLNASLTAQNKVYDGTKTEPNSNMTCALVGVVSGDVSLTSCTPSGGTFNSSQVLAANNTVTATATIGGTAASNYTFGLTGTSVNSTSVMVGASITPAPVTATAGSLSGTYNGLPQSPSLCTVTTTAPNGFVGTVTCMNSPASETNAGSGMVTPTMFAVGAGDSLSNYFITPANGSWSIAPAPSMTTVMCLPGPFTYTGSPQTPCSASVSGAGGLSMTNLPPIYMNNTNAGMNTASASYAYLGDTNHTGSMGSATFTIGQASATTTISSVSPEPSIGNQQVTVSVTVAPVAPATGAPTGTVTVTSEGGSLSCMVMLATESSCALPAFTTPGTNTVTATYSGDTNFTAGTAATDSNTPGNGNGVAVNPVTNLIYVSNYNDQTVSVIDGTQNTITATIPVPGYPAGIGVNSATDTIYVALGAQTGVGSLAVINGATNSVTTTVPVDQAPFAVAVNPTTNMIYVTNNFGAVGGNNNDGTVSVINGSSNTLATTFHVGVNPSGVAIDPATNYLYLTIYNFDGSGSGSTSVEVLDGTAGTVLGSVAPSAPPWLIDINPTTHRAYVTESGPFGGNNVDVIDITTASSPALVAAVPVGNDPYGVAVDATDNLVYVSNYSGNTVSVIDGLSNTVRQTIAVGSNPQGVAFNPASASAYVANGGSNTMSVIVVPTLASIAVTPSSPSITGTGTQQFTATGTYSDTTTRNLTNLVTWASSATNVATITTGPGAGAGLATGVSPGPTTISAALNVTGSTQLTVNPLAPSITSPTTGFITTSPVQVSGTALTGATTVTIYDGATQVATATPAAFGTGVSVLLSVGVGHSLTATQTVNGATSAASSPAITGTVNPVAPSITSPTTGFSTTSPVQVSGTALSGATVTIYDGATPVATAMAAAFGAGVGVPLSVGPGHSLTAIQTLNGATSAASSPAITGTVNPPPATFGLTGSLTTARSNPTVTLLQNGQVLVAGGFDGSNPLASAELYDPNTGLFTVTGSMSAPRYVHTATLLPNGQVLITGGQGTSITPQSAELYDPTAMTFSLLTNSMTTPRSNHTATLLQNGQVLLAGGNSSGPSAELYNPNTGMFTATTGSMGTDRYVANAALLPNGQVLIVGGISSGPNIYQSSAELYDPAAGTFSYTTNSMSTARGYFTGTLLQNGQFLAAGGYNGFNQVLTADLYDPTAGTFSLLTNSMTNQQGGPATLLGDGQVLIVGGYNGSSLTTAELYNPTTQVFSLTGSMTTARNGPAAVLLPNGEVLVVGGANNPGGGGPSVVLASAELYTPPN